MGSVLDIIAYILPLSPPSICTSRYLAAMSCNTSPATSSKMAIVSFIFGKTFQYDMQNLYGVRK